MSIFDYRFNMLQESPPISKVRSSQSSGVSSPSPTSPTFNLSAISSSGQIWKDLQRDNVSINGELHGGGQHGGPVGVIGSLMRHLLDKVVIIRQHQSDRTGGPSSSGIEHYIGDKQSNFSNSSLPFSNSHHFTETLVSSSAFTGVAESKASGTRDGAELTLDSKKSTTLAPSEPPAAPSSPASPTSPVSPKPFNLTYANALVIALKLLSLSHRTAAGGDTYDCIQRALAMSEGSEKWNNGNHVCVLSPLHSQVKL